MRILIADDDPISLRGLSHYLEMWSYDIIECKNGLEAWEIIQKEGAPNLIILDWIMPGMDGVELCHNISFAK